MFISKHTFLVALGALALVAPVGAASADGPLASVSEKLGGAPVGVGRCVKTSVAMAGATVAMAVVVTPGDGVDPGDEFVVRGYVFTPDQVIVKVCNVSQDTATPEATVYNIRLLR